jgi:hypothetical protein
MGGYGSGNHRGSRYTVDAALHVPIGWMIRQCPIREGIWRHSMRWIMHGEETGSIGYTLTRDHEKPVSLVITCTRNKQHFKQELKLEHQRMPKGGVKTYAICPYCHRKRLVLLICSRYWFCCRTCADYTYQSCQDSKKFSGFFGELSRLLAEETRWDRQWESIRRNRERCREWRKRRK